MAKANDNAKNKTNAMRILDRIGIPYIVHSYDASDGQIDGVSVAHKTGLPEERVYKTLVCQASDGQYAVFVIPVALQLDLKQAAKSVGAKSVSMIKVADIVKITGYVRGGCSPVGMKKEYRTVIDASCLAHEHIAASAGKIGAQIELKPQDLIDATHATTADIATL